MRSGSDRPWPRRSRRNAPTPDRFSALPPRDTFIPLRLRDMEPLLCAAPGMTRLQRTTWQELARLVEALCHHEAMLQRGRLIELYTPIDPDSEWQCVDGFTPRRGDGSFVRFLDDFETMLVAANYQRLDRDAIEAAIEETNETGIRYEPQLELFDQLQVYVRGQTVIRREWRSLRNPLKKRVVVHPGYRRMVVAFKFRPDVDPGAELTCPDVLYLRLFKNVPRVDMEMHLPEQGTRIKMRLIDKAQIASPVAMGLPPLLVKLAGITSIFTMPIGTLLALMAAPFSEAAKSFFGFQRAKNRHLHNMIRHLYYLNLANNRAVIESLADSAAEEQIKEILLAYFVLWRSQTQDKQEWTHERLDQAIEELLYRLTGLHLDFEIGDAVGKLRRLGLLRNEVGQPLEILPPREALRKLDTRWDQSFRYAEPG